MLDTERMVFLKSLMKTITEDRNSDYSGEEDGTEHPVHLYRTYAEGKQKVHLTKEHKRFLEGLTGHRMIDNICGQVITHATGRLRLSQLQASDKPTDKSTAGPNNVDGFIQDLFIKNRIHSISNRVHRSMCIDGDAFVAVGYDFNSKRVRIYRERAWDGNSGMYVRYSEEDENTLYYAVKEWVSGDTRRRNVWMKGVLYKWFSTTKSVDTEDWQPFLVEGEDWPLPFTDTSGNPLPIPIVHFPNPTRASGTKGVSEIAGIIGLQDQIFDIGLTQVGAARLTGYQMYTVSGADHPKQGDPDVDSSEDEDEFEVGPAQLWISSDPNTKYGVLPPGDLRQLILMYEHKAGRISAITQTPLHLISGGDWPSGEALIRAEQPAINKAQTQIEVLQECWKQVAYFAVLIYNSFGPGGLDSSVVISARMLDPSKGDRAHQAAIARMVSDFVSNREVLRILGYSESEINLIESERASEAESAAQSAMAAFNSGRLTGNGS
jgi:hypothetical protein